jgi:hypothetical protein
MMCNLKKFVLTVICAGFTSVALAQFGSPCSGLINYARMQCEKTYFDQHYKIDDAMLPEAKPTQSQHPTITSPLIPKSPLLFDKLKTPPFDTPRVASPMTPTQAKELQPNDTTQELIEKQEDPRHGDAEHFNPYK